MFLPPVMMVQERSREVNSMRHKLQIRVPNLPQSTVYLTILLAVSRDTINIIFELLFEVQVHSFSISLTPDMRSIYFRPLFRDDIDLLSRSLSA